MQKVVSASSSRGAGVMCRIKSWGCYWFRSQRRRREHVSKILTLLLSDSGMMMALCRGLMVGKALLPEAYARRDAASAGLTTCCGRHRRGPLKVCHCRATKRGIGCSSIDHGVGRRGVAGVDEVNTRRCRSSPVPLVLALKHLGMSKLKSRIRIRKAIRRSHS
jgi:hypothetical protein